MNKISHELHKLWRKLLSPWFGSSHLIIIVDSQYNQVNQHNIIQIHDNVLWDLQHSTKYSWIFPHSYWMWGILCRILSVLRNVIMDLNNVMKMIIGGFHFSVYCFFQYKIADAKTWMTWSIVRSKVEVPYRLLIFIWMLHGHLYLSSMW